MRFLLGTEENTRAAVRRKGPRFMETDSTLTVVASVPMRHLHVVMGSRPVPSHALCDLDDHELLSLCPHKPIKQSPRKHKAAQSVENITAPQVSEWTVEIIARLPVCAHSEYQR